MNPLDDQLDRLFRAAESRRPDPVPPYGLETRVLAAWRDARFFDGWSPGLLIQGIFAACILMILSFWPLLEGVANPDSDYLQLADSTLQVSNKL
jgi:hypothetical protein